jgi:hypothetical protein
MDTSGKSSGTLAPLWRNRDSVLLESGLRGHPYGRTRTISLVASPLGRLLAGWLLEATSPRPTVAACAVGGMALALWGTLSPSMRSAPSLAELAT